MENKDTKRDYQEVVTAVEQQWEIVEITIGVIFFVWDSYSLFFKYTGNFQVPPEKNHPQPKFQFSLVIQIWPKFVLYKPSNTPYPPLNNYRVLY